jgi:hypothetical protein
VLPEYRPDSVSVLRDRKGKVASAMIVEVLLEVDEGRRRMWPVYVASACARFDCPVTLLVLAPDPAVARWARRPIQLGHPGFVLQPIVIDFDQVPRITDHAQACETPELAVLSALAHRDVETAEAARAALDMMSEKDRKRYWAAILARLPPKVRQILELHMRKAPGTRATSPAGTTRRATVRGRASRSSST